jgi:hypothetical protein
MLFLSEVITLLQWKEPHFASYMKRGGRTRIRALGDWFSFHITPNHLSPADIATDPHPEITLADTVRAMKQRGVKLYKAKELVTQVSAFYKTFCGKPNVGSNAVITATLNEWELIPKPPHRYTDVMPVEKVLSWLQNLGDNTSLNRFTLYKKFLITLQLSCIARTADIFRLRFDTLERDKPPGSLTFITSTKTSRGRGFLYYLFEIPKAPRICPVQTTLAFKRKFEEEVFLNGWRLPPHFIHVNEAGIPLKNPAQLAKIMKTSYRDAGINTQRWNVNNSRHAVITFYKGKGISEEQIKLITGHSLHSKVTHDFYTHPVKEWSDKSILSALSTQIAPYDTHSSDHPNEELSPSDPDFGTSAEDTSDSVEIIISPKSQLKSNTSSSTPNNHTPPHQTIAPVPLHITDLDQFRYGKDE